MVYVLAAGHSRNSSRLLKTLGVYNTLIAEGMVDASVYEFPVLDNNITESGSYSPVWRDRIRELMEARFSKRPAAGTTAHLASPRRSALRHGWGYGHSPLAEHLE